MKIRQILSIGCFLWILASLRLAAQQPEIQPLPIDPKIRYGQLNNGLTYYIRHNAQPKDRADFFIAQNVGSILEDENQRGLAHFLEHMAFDGTKNFPGHGMDEFTESIGMRGGENFNAYTSFDETVYMIMNAPVTRESIVDSCLLILHDWSGFITLADTAIEKERGVIREEWRTRQDAQARIWEQQLPKMFPDNKYAYRMPIGTIDVINNFKPDELRDYYKKWYRPDLQGIIIVGDIDVDKVEAAVKRIFADIPAPVNPAKREYTEVADNDKPLVSIATDKEASNMVLSIFYKHDKMPKELYATGAGLMKDYMENVVETMINERFAEMMNRCGYDYVTLGNHDFNYGMPYLDSYLNVLKARCVCENVRWDEAGVRFPARIHTLENGLRVGIIGIVTDYVNIWEKPEHLAGIAITDPIPAAAAALERLRDQVDLTVGIYHGGFERDLATGRVLSATRENVAYRICQELDLDILLTGHQHMSVPGQMVSGTFVVQPSDKGQEFLRVEAAVSGSGKRFSSETVPAHGECRADWLAEFADMERGAQAWLDQVVGHLETPMLPDTPLRMAAEGSALADLFNTVQLAASGAQLSVTSLANDAAGLPQTVRRRDILNAYPYTNTLTVLEITGAVLRRAMERSAEYFTRNADGSLRVSDCFLEPKVEHYNYDYYAGVTYAYDIARPVGERVVELTFNGTPVKDTDVFTACLSSYRASGTGGYDGYVGCPIVREIGTEMSDLLLDYFKRYGGELPLARGEFRVF